MLAGPGFFLKPIDEAPAKKHRRETAAAKGEHLLKDRGGEWRFAIRCA